MKPVDARYKTYGCEVVNNLLTTGVSKYPKMLGYKNVLKVPRRKRGLTSSGFANKCHENVVALCTLYGGMQVSGLKVCFFSNHRVSFHHHSVWKTPEGKLVEITQENVDVEVKDREEDFTFFMPYEEIEKTPHHFSYSTDFLSIILDGNKTGKFQVMEYGEITQSLKKQHFKDLIKKKIIKRTRVSGEGYRCEWKINDDGEPELMSICEDGEWENIYSGGFSKPSLFTGRTFDENVMNRVALKDKGVR